MAWFGFWVIISIVSIGDDGFIVKSAIAMFSREVKTYSVTRVYVDSTHSFRHDYHRRYAIASGGERIRYFGCFGNFYPKDVMKVKCCKWGCYWDFDVYVSFLIWFFNFILGSLMLIFGIKRLARRNGRN